MKEAVKLGSGLDIVMEESPVGEHQSNGMVEAAIKQVQGQIRTMKDALQTRYGGKAPEGHQCTPWLVQHAAQTMNRRRVDAYGVTPHKRWKGRNFGAHVTEFGENVWYTKAESVGKDK